MHSLEMMTLTVPWWGTLLIMLALLYLAVFLNINPDFYLPVYYVPVRLIPGIVILVAMGYFMPRVRFKMFPPFTSINALGVLPSGKELGIFLGIFSLVLSLIAWAVYSVVRPREERTTEKENGYRKEDY